MLATTTTHFCLDGIENFPFIEAPHGANQHIPRGITCDTVDDDMLGDNLQLVADDGDILLLTEQLQSPLNDNPAAYGYWSSSEASEA